MELIPSEVRWYERTLSPLIRYLTRKYELVQRIAVCDNADGISVICDNKIVITMNSSSFECVYCADEVKKNAKELCTMVHILCKKLDCYQYRIRQIVVHSSAYKWSDGLSKGEIKLSVEKVSERVVMLTCR